jgi:hypothetical protein
LADALRHVSADGNKTTLGLKVVVNVGRGRPGSVGVGRTGQADAAVVDEISAFFVLGDD